MPLLLLHKATLAFGHVPLLDSVDLQLDRGDRACLLGRNGAGKSSLLKVIAGDIPADAGEVRLERGARVAYLPQEPGLDDAGSVFENVARGLGEQCALVSAYRRAAARVAARPIDGEALTELQQLQAQLDASGAWLAQREIARILSVLGLASETPVATLSGGWRRRVAFARALVGNPDLLLLDEPTNHLDIEAIAWLEGLLDKFPGAVLFVTHDRQFLRKVATRIVELDRGRFAEYPGSYDRYLEKKAAALEVEARADALFDKRLAQEEQWIRQGIKARRTRNEGRVRALKAQREARAQRRVRQGQARLALDSGESSGKLVLEAKGLGHAYEGQAIVRDLDLRVMRGDRVGIIGPNGAGKTTLLKLLLKALPPQHGEVRHGTKLQVAYFDQLRAQLDPEAKVVDVVAEGRTGITIDGKTKHVMSYLGDFLFPPERARSPVKALSGGERHRLLLARLFTQPANLLVLDEPTNDLDLDTLELLEELLLDYPGTLFLVSHDRAFLDNVVTSCLAFEGDGVVREYVGGYSDWLRQRAPRPAQTSTVAQGAAPVRTTKESKKLSYKEQRELEALPARIDALERERDELQARLADPAAYANGDEARNLSLRLKTLETELEAAFARWEQLEAQQT